MKIEMNEKLKSRKGLLITPIFENYLDRFPKNYPDITKKFLLKLVKNKEFWGHSGEIGFSYADEENLSDKILLFGFGKIKNYTSKIARELGAKIGKEAIRLKEKNISIFFSKELAKYTEEFMEGILMIQYDIGKLKTKYSKKERYDLESLNILVEKSLLKNIKKDLEKAKIIADAIEYVKDLVNNPSNFVDMDYLADEARKIAKENGYKINILGNKELEKLNAGGILAVNSGSEKEAKLIFLEYKGAKNKNEKPIAIVGKGVVFDTGGYNLKPFQHIETMHQDMAGCAVVLGLFKVMKKLGIKKNVIGITPSVANMVNEKAFKPSDIITMMSGLTVEVTNTDAEGRLILGDAITYAAKFDPKNIITIATLTGAVALALGDRYAGLLGNNTKLRRELMKAGKEVDDLGWGLPLHSDYKKAMDSAVADIRNRDVETYRMAGCSKGAAFLEKFVEGNTWCHIDIGGTAFTDSPKPYQTRGATAHGFKMLLRYLEK
ncbi:leucyl aminopeptidase [Candidatus Peregrinibacteria bacterium]|nr:leucyl aminopeptidase [Candidatus Peregrinibacteria bacterium]